MKQWLAAGAAVVVIVLLVLLMREVWSDDAAARPADPQVEVAKPPPPPRRPTPVIATHDDEEDIPHMGSIEIDESEDHAPITKYSDKFWEHVDGYRRPLIGKAAPCYKGGLPRKLKMKVSYGVTIKEGVVTLRNVRMTESNLGNPALEKCILEALTTAQLHDPRMPDWESKEGDDEDLVIRVMLFKRFMDGQNDGQED